MDLHIEENAIEIWKRICMVPKMMMRLRNEELRKYQITTRQAAMLQGINDLGGQATITNIAQRQHRLPNTVSNIIIRMEKLGLVKRLENPKDRRQLFVVMTKKGEELFRLTSRKDAIQQVISGLSEDTQDQLLKALEELRSITRGKLES